MAKKISYFAIPNDVENQEHAIAKSRKTYMPSVLTVLLSISVALNLFMFGRSTRPSTEMPLGSRYMAASLTRDHETVFQDTSDFSSLNRTIQSVAWDSDLVDPRRFALALSDSYTESLGLEHSMRWPWDKHRGVYITHSGHELHCLHLLRDTANDLHDGVRQRWTYEHQIHCVDLLLQGVMCHADDTILYTGFLNGQSNATKPMAGEGATRMCRDWTKLMAWADERSACYDPYFLKEETNFREVDRYKFCPDGSKPWESME